MSSVVYLTPQPQQLVFQDGARLALVDQGILPSCEEATLALLRKRSHLVAT